MDYSDIENLFLFHPAKDQNTAEGHEAVRDRAKDYALWIMENVNPCEERDIAINKLREVMMWTNTAIAIHGKRL